MKNNKSEIINSITAFKKETYCKSELLPELLKLQDEIVNITFSGNPVKKPDLRLCDVNSYLYKLNEAKNRKYSTELQKVIIGSKTVEDLIKGEISGINGEKYVCSQLSKLRRDYILLRNIELVNESMRTELDAIVITSCGIFILEAKSTKKNVLIEGNGSYYKTGQWTRFDSNLLEKISQKEYLLNEVLKQKGIRNVPIFSYVVFNNGGIELHNCSKELNICFASNVPYIIDRARSNRFYNEKERNQIATVIEEAQTYGAYSADQKVKSFINDYASLMEKLNSTSETEKPKAIQQESSSHLSTWSHIFECVSAAAMVAISVLKVKKFI